MRGCFKVHIDRDEHAKFNLIPTVVPSPADVSRSPPCSPAVFNTTFHDVSNNYGAPSLDTDDIDDCYWEIRYLLFVQLHCHNDAAQQPHM